MMTLTRFTYTRCNCGFTVLDAGAVVRFCPNCKRAMIWGQS